MIDERPVGAALNRDISRGERAEKDIEAFISKRHDSRVRDGDEYDEEAAWRESERQAEAERRVEWQQARKEFLEHLEGVYSMLLDETRQEVEKLRTTQPNSNPEGA